MATKRLTPKRIKADIEHEVGQALVNKQLNIMDLGEVTTAAEAAYAAGDSRPILTHADRLAMARAAAEKKAEELRTDKQRPAVFND